MTTRKIKRNMVGGAGLIRGTSLIKKPETINQDFASLFKYYLSSNDIKKDNFLTVNDDDVDIIYIGLKENENIIFGDIIKQYRDGLIIEIKFKELLHIKNTPENINFVNQFKLHMMSIMANYTLNGHKLLIELNDPIKKLDYSAIMKLLEIKEVPVVKPPPAPLQNDDMLELYIYREFGIKCILKGECYKSIETKFFQNNPNIQRNKLKESTFRDLYVNLFDYITGSEISVFSKEKGLLSCVEKIDVALKDLKIILTEYVFNGARTNYKFNIKTLITCMNNIRVKVNASLEITGGYHISNDIFI